MTHDMRNEVFYENYTEESRLEGSIRMFGGTSMSKFLVYRDDFMPAMAVSNLISSFVVNRSGHYPYFLAFLRNSERVHQWYEVVCFIISPFSSLEALLF